MLLNTCRYCSPLGRPGTEGGGIGIGERTARTRAFTVDLHCHFHSADVEALVAKHPMKLAEPAERIQTWSEESALHNARVLWPSILPKVRDLDVRLKDMDEMDVDVQVLSPSPAQYYYWADRDLAAQIVETHNNDIAAACRARPDRFLGLGNVALQHPELAAAQLRSCMRDLGMVGVEISSSVEGRELADPVFDPFWHAAEELGAIVFIHPLGTSAWPRLNKYYLTNVIGQPLETEIALSHLIFSGTLDRYPYLKIVAAHGGGHLPSYFGRAAHAYKVRPEAARIARPPTEYLRQMWFDTLVFEPEVLRHLINVVGASQVVVGTDYPFDMGHYRINELLDAVAGLTDAEREAILGGNARKLLGVDTRRMRNASR